MASSQDRQHRAHLAGNAAAAVAGAASAPFGAAKLRDSFKESYPARFVRGLEHLERGAQRHGMGQQHGARLVRVVSRGKPGFVPLATATVAATGAGGARRYERHLERRAVHKGLEDKGVGSAGAAVRARARGLHERALAGGNHQVAEAAGQIGTLHPRPRRGRLGQPDRGRLHETHERKLANFNVRLTNGQPASLPKFVARATRGGLVKADRGRRLELASGTGSVLAVRGAARSRKVGRGHLVRAADLERDSDAAFSAARQQGEVVTQRLVRHTTTGPGSLPRTSGNLANTGRAHLKQQGHLHAGLAARDASHAATAAGRKAMGRSKGKLALAAGLGGVAAASTSRQRY